MSRLLPAAIDLKLQATDDNLEYWQQVFSQHHNIWQDHQALKQGLDLSENEFARHFDSLRRVYPDRFEYERYRLKGAQKKAAAIARELLFKIA